MNKMQTTQKPMRIFGLHVLSDESRLLDKSPNQDAQKPWDICQRANEGCNGAKYAEVFDTICNGNYDSCSQSKINVEEGVCVIR